MNKQVKWINKWLLPIQGIILSGLGYLSWGLFTISYKSELFDVLAVVATVATMVCFMRISYSCRQRGKRNDIRIQWNIVCMLAFICSILMLFRGGSALWRENNFKYLFIEILWSAVFLHGVFLLYDKSSFKAVSVRQFLREHLGVIVLVMVTIALCVEPDAFQYKWDGILYYLSGKELSLQSLSSLAIYGHIAQTFGAFVQIGNIVFGNVGVSMFVLNLSLMIISIIFFYRIVRQCLPDKSEWIYVLMTAIYAWSPYLLGMVPYYNLDFACQCLVPPVLYYLMKKKWILFALFAVLFCFTKEPAIIVYGAMCAGYVLIDIINDKNFTIIERIKRCFGRTQYYIMVMPGFLWVATYEMLGPWSAGNGGVELDIVYIIEKIKNLYILNFNWVFTLSAIMGFIILLWKKDYELGKNIFPLFCMQLSFTLFSCLFKTVNHARYNDTNQVTLYLIAIILLWTYMKQAVCSGWGIVMSVLLLISSFYTIDPVSLSLYSTYRVGQAIMLTTGDEPLGDAMIYNRQMLGMEKALGMAIAESIEDNALLCFPAINHNPYYFDGMATVGEITEYRFDTEYWDRQGLKRTPEIGENTTEFTVCQVPVDINIKDIDFGNSKLIDIIYTDCAGKQIYDMMRNEFPLVEDEAYYYRGWTIHRARFCNEQASETILSLNWREAQ